MSQAASDKQIAYIDCLIEQRVIPDGLLDEIMMAEANGLSHIDCVRFIPLLQECPKIDRRTEGSENYFGVDEYGYWDGPDMGVHQFDGGLGDGSFL